MVEKVFEYVLPFWYNTGVWQPASQPPSHPATQPPSHVAIAITLNALAKASSLKNLGFSSPVGGSD